MEGIVNVPIIFEPLYHARLDLINDTLWTVVELLALCWKIDTVPFEASVDKLDQVAFCLEDRVASCEVGRFLAIVQVGHRVTTTSIV